METPFLGGVTWKIWGAMGSSYCWSNFWTQENNFSQWEQLTIAIISPGKWWIPQHWTPFRIHLDSVLSHLFYTLLLPGTVGQDDPWDTLSTWYSTILWNKNWKSFVGGPPKPISPVQRFRFKAFLPTRKHLWVSHSFLYGCVLTCGVKSLSLLPIAPFSPLTVSSIHKLGAQKNLHREQVTWDMGDASSESPKESSDFSLGLPLNLMVSIFPYI